MTDDKTTLPQKPPEAMKEGRMAEKPVEEAFDAKKEIEALKSAVEQLTSQVSEVKAILDKLAEEEDEEQPSKTEPEAVNPDIGKPPEEVGMKKDLTDLKAKFEAQTKEVEGLKTMLATFGKQRTLASGSAKSGEMDEIDGLIKKYS